MKGTGQRSLPLGLKRDLEHLFHAFNEYQLELIADAVRVEMANLNDIVSGT